MDAMRGRLFIGLIGAALLAGCGSATKTVTVAQTPTGSTTAPSSTTTSTTSSTPAATTTTTAPSTTGSSTSTTRTAPEPSFAEKEQEAKGGALGAAVAALRERGYTARNTAEYHSNQTLRVLVGTRAESGDGYGQQAFFFLEGHYLGTDAKEPSATLKVVSQSDTEVTISYPLYRTSDPLCCPGGGSRTVHFALNDGKLSALGAIPPAHSSTGLSRN